MANAEQKVKVVGEKNLTSSFPNFRPFDSATSTTLFDMGTTRVTTNLVPSKVTAYKSRLVTTAQQVTLEGLRIKSLDKARIIRQYSDKILLRPDRTDLTSYSYFGSLVELLRVSLNHVVQTWPGSLFVNPEVLDVGRLASVLNLSYNSADNTSTFQIPIVVCDNKFGINLLDGVSTYPENDLRNLQAEAERYVLGYEGTELPVIGITGQTTTTSQFITVKVRGQAFPDAGTPVAFAREYHIQPSGDEIGLYLRGVTELSRYLLNTGSEPRFNALFRYPDGETDDTVEQYVTWPCSDGVNPDLDGPLFSDYQEGLFALAQVYDNHKTNLLIRRLVPSSILDHDQSYSGKMSQLLQGYAREFDKVKAFIDGLAHLNTVTYDRMNNAPDALVMNLARTLGWDTFPIASDETGVIDALFNANVKHGDTKISPAEVDTELWRRVVMNSTWLLQSKGTRQALEAILGLVGAPEALVEFNEYIYLADKRMRIATDVIAFDFNTQAMSRGMVDAAMETEFASQGLVEDAALLDSTATLLRPEENIDIDDLVDDPNLSPVSELNTSGKFVSKNVQGLRIIDEPNQELPDRSLIPEEPINLDYPQPPLFIPFQQRGGDQDYMQAVTNQGFTLKRTVDNKKSWIASTGTTRSHGLTETQYEQGDSRMVVNSKEVGINLNPARAVEYDVFGFVKEQGYPIGTLLAAPYPQTTAQTDIDVNGMGFFEFVDKVYERFIDARTRKTSRSYPTLNRIYLDYLRNTESATGTASSALTVARIMAFTSRVGTSWNQLMEQVLPATTILTESGLHVRNTVFETQKFVYKPGMDAGSEFKSLQPINLIDAITISQIGGSVDEGLKDTVYLTELVGDAYVGQNSNINTDRFSSLSASIKSRPRCKMNVYSFTPPTFSATGAGKIASGQTPASIVHEFDVNARKDFSINFLGTQADVLRGPLAAEVGIIIYPYLPAQSKFSNTFVYRQMLNSSSVTGTTMGTPIALTASVPNIVLKPNTEYLIKVFFVKKELIPGHRLPEVPQAPFTMYDEFVSSVYPQQFRFHPKYYNRANYTAVNSVTFSSEPTIGINGLGLPYGTYDSNRDFYFASVGRPEKPRPLFTTKPLTTLDEYVYGSATSQVKTFTLTNRAVSGFTVQKNGIGLVPDVDFIATPGFVGAALGTHYTLTEALDGDDVLRLTYKTFEEKVEPVISTLTVPTTGLTAGQTNNNQNPVWYNASTGLVEIILPSIPVAGALTVEVNGVIYSGSQLNQTFSGPSPSSYSLPSGVPFTVSGRITARYLRYLPEAIDGHPLLTQPTNVDFEVLNGSESNGTFLIEMAEETDFEFRDVLVSDSVPFVAGQRYFRWTKDIRDTPGITPRGKYLIRITARNTFTTLSLASININSIADIYKVRLGNLRASTFGSGSGTIGIGITAPPVVIAPETPPITDPEIPQQLS